MKTEPDQAVAVSWDWERDRYLRASRELWRRRRRSWLGRLGWVGVFLIGAGFGYIEFGYVGALTLGPVATILGVFGGSLGARVEMRIRAWRFAQKCLPKYLHTEVEIGRDGIALRNADSSAELKWTAFERYEETDEHFLLYYGKATGRYLPKTRLDANQVELVRSYLASGIGTGGHGA